MAASPSQIRAYRILGFLAIVHSSVVLSFLFSGEAHFLRSWVWWWLGLATLLFFWLIVLLIHPGRSVPRFLIPTIIATALFLPCAPFYAGQLQHSARQWRVAHNLNKLLRSNPKMILYSIDADYREPLDIPKGYRPVGTDEIILPDDLCDNCVESFVRMDDAAIPARIAACLGHTVNSNADETNRSNYGWDWQILRKEANGSNEAQAEIAVPPDRRRSEWDREPYKGPAILGYAEITDPAEQRTLMSALAGGARRSEGGYLCHNPRHGLYVETSTMVIDFSICFECENVYPFGPHDKLGAFADVGSFGITRSPESVFNAAVKRHGITMSRPTP
jgi:hypothetical protein